MFMIEIIYLTWNRLNLTKQSLPALLETKSKHPFKVFIHDNGSTDGTPKWLKTLDSDKIGEITYGTKNEGIAPVVNRFWNKTKSDFIGKIDNDIIVPTDWINEIMLRLENAEAEKIGSVSLNHWIPEWESDWDPKKLSIYNLKNKSQLLRSYHTGGNYIFHRYLFNLLGKSVNSKLGLKGGYTSWQWQKSRDRMGIKCGYVYPFKFFKLPAFIESWKSYKAGKNPQQKKYWDKERYQQCKRLLEMTF